MNKKSFKRTEKRLEDLQEVFTKQVEAVADEFRERHLIPFCRRHRLTFLSGNGSWGFYRISNGDVVPDWELKAVGDINQGLYLECMGQPLGWYVQDVSEEDL